MSKELPHGFFVNIREDISFVEDWQPLVQFSELYIPVGSGDHLAADPNDMQSVMDFVDIVLRFLGILILGSFSSLFDHPFG